MGPGRRRVAWTEGARRELDEAMAYIAEDSVDAAVRVLDRIVEAAGTLDLMGERGRVVPGEGIRVFAKSSSIRSASFTT